MAAAHNIGAWTASIHNFFKFNQIRSLNERRSMCIPDTGLYVKVLSKFCRLWEHDLRTEREGVAEKQTIELVSCQKIS